MKDLITKYNEIVDEICFEFAKRIDKDIGEEDYRIMRYKGVLQGPLQIYDESNYDIRDILLTIQHNIPINIVNERCNFSITELCKPEEERNNINLYNYWRKTVLSPEILEKEKQDDLKKSEENMNIAKEALEDCILQMKKKKLGK